MSHAHGYVRKWSAQCTCTQKSNLIHVTRSWRTSRHYLTHAGNTGPALAQRWAGVFDDGPTLSQRWSRGCYQIVQCTDMSNSSSRINPYQRFVDHIFTPCLCHHCHATVGSTGFKGVLAPSFKNWIKSKLQKRQNLTHKCNLRSVEPIDGWENQSTLSVQNLTSVDDGFWRLKWIPALNK